MARSSASMFPILSVNSITRLPGEDGPTYWQWKRLDLECTVLTEVINVCLRYKMVPPTWKKAAMVLIYKKGAKEDLNNWQHISLPDAVRGAGQLTEWLVFNKVLSPCQKGFLPADGAFEHVHTLNRVLEKARTHAADKWVVLAGRHESVRRDPAPRSGG